MMGHFNLKAWNNVPNHVVRSSYSFSYSYVPHASSSGDSIQESTTYINNIIELAVY